MTATVAAAPAPPAPGSGTLSRGAQRLVIAGMIALCSLGAFESLAVSTAMPTVAVDLDGLRHYTLAFAVALATGVVGMLAADPPDDARRDDFFGASFAGVSVVAGGSTASSSSAAMPDPAAPAALPHHQRAIERFTAAAIDRGALGVIVVGSAARGTARPDSDVDVYEVIDDVRFASALAENTAARRSGANTRATSTYSATP